MVRHEDFLKEDLEFTTPEHRQTYWSKMLTEKPLLQILVMHYLVGSTLDLPFIYSDNKRGSTEKKGRKIDLDNLAMELQKLIQQRLQLWCDIIFMALFNVNPLIKDGEWYIKEAGAFPSWVSTNSS